jgi:predicted nucleic acid-binding protein
VSVFADTSALYALLVRTELGHAEVAAAFEGLLESGRVLVTSNYVLVETTALLQRRIGLAAVRDLNERILPVLSIQWVSESLHRRAVDRLVRSDRRGLSLVDCASFEVMEREGLREVLALDSDFADAGFRLLPEAPAP